MPTAWCTSSSQHREPVAKQVHPAPPHHAGHDGTVHEGEQEQHAGDGEVDSAEVDPGARPGVGWPPVRARRHPPRARHGARAPARIAGIPGGRLEARQRLGRALPPPGRLLSRARSSAPRLGALSTHTVTHRAGAGRGGRGEGGRAAVGGREGAWAGPTLLRGGGSGPPRSGLGACVCVSARLLPMH